MMKHPGNRTSLDAGRRRKKKKETSAEWNREGCVVTFTIVSKEKEEKKSALLLRGKVWEV